MPAGQWITAQCLATKKARHDARLVTMPAAVNLAIARRRSARRTSMSPAEFIALVVGWSAGIVLLLFVSALARYFS